MVFAGSSWSLNHEEDVEMSFLRARTPRIGKY